MNEPKGGSDNNKLTLSGSQRRTLQLKKSVDPNQARQGSSGRNKVLVVERKRRRLARDTSREHEAEQTQSEEELKHEGESGRTLTEHEIEARTRALEEARKRREEEAREATRREEEERRKAKEKEKAEAAREGEEAPEIEAESPAEAAEAEAPGEVEAPEQEAPAEESPAAGKEEKPKARRGETVEEEAERKGKKAAKPATDRRSERRKGKLRLTDALQDEEEGRQRSMASIRRARERQKQARQERQPHEPPSKVLREVVIPEAITVQELSNRMAERASEVIKALMKMGVMATINQTLDADTAELVVEEFGHKSRRVSEADVELGLFGDEDVPETLKARAPVVTVMGHVDHGKTSLLDAMRETDVVAGEAGGITQHIGAYQITTEDGNKITFIDTPGHEAFTAMRARGAKVTDIVILVVAADDGLMPQTIEAINHARAAGVPLIVAINKIDRPDANPDKIRQGLLQHEVVVEELGGDVLSVEVSATKRQNLDKLQEAILLQSELLELKANPDRTAEGIVIESKLEKGRGSVATLLVQRGTLHVGDVFVAGAEWGRVRALLDERGAQLEKAGPSQPAEVLGLSGAPEAGDEFAAVEDESRAREIAEYRQRQIREKQVSVTGRTSLEAMFSSLKEDKLKELPIVIKADVQGSVEAITGALEKLSTEEVAVRVIHSGVGGITESDINLAQSSEAVVTGFNVRATRQARSLAEESGVEIRYYSVIYDLVDDMKAALTGMLAPRIQETQIGAAEVKEVFKVSKVGQVAGCLVTDGVARSGAKVAVLRDNVVVHEGKLSSLKRFKDEVKEVRAGTECGMSIENFQDVKAGDVIELYEVEEIQRTL